jgi:predicted secreted hydrolase
MEDMTWSAVLTRRACLWAGAGLCLSAWPVGAQSAQAQQPPAQPVLPKPLAVVRPDTRLRFPRDHGAHPDFRTEWWYATGVLRTPAGEELGFQLTFFRSRVDEAEGRNRATATSAASPSPALGRFAPRQLLFAHAAVTDVAARQMWHGQRMARWNGEPTARPAFAMLADTHVSLADWHLQRHDLPGGHSRYVARLGDADMAYQLDLATTQPLLLQGQAGYSRKGPDASHASHYYSQPHLRVTGSLQRRARVEAVTGIAWLDHEWSETLMPADAVGWDWIGMNLHNGAALTAFRLRRADGTAVWAGGSWRTGPAPASPGPVASLGAADATAQAFGPNDVVWQPLAWWVSPLSGARYPVRWALVTPVGRFEVHARVDAQELDSRATTGAVYWEGLSDLVDPVAGQRVGQGYLEMTGYTQRLELGG